MIPEYLQLVARIQQELHDLESVVTRAERGIQATRQRPEDQDLYIDSVALNLHDFYAGLERIFQQIGSTVDGNIPSGHNWHQDLLQQMHMELPELRPSVLSAEAMQMLDEFLRFRHVVRNIYAFQFDPERITRLVSQMRPAWMQVQTELLAFASFLEQVAK
ncbi:MAG: hypothetical protein KJ063_24830 [Anaerolineae bacterium]|nr:hypothetical protein [Anaerolineae bacterium]